ncbi:MAG: glycine dehydrogenase (aminomethyl-transferring), partial [Burkholderiales bacterium]|nr:glycine dehydrogenase (aminomethyl-transferring) [Burkholderiales bacterium]
MQSADTFGGIRSLFADDEFHARHLGPSASQETAMLAALGYAARADLIEATVPPAIRLRGALALPEPTTEAGALAELRGIAAGNQIWRSYIGAGYHGTLTPEPIR